MRIGTPKIKLAVLQENSFGKACFDLNASMSSTEECQHKTNLYLALHSYIPIQIRYQKQNKKSFAKCTT